MRTKSAGKSWRPSGLDHAAPVMPKGAQLWESIMKINLAPLAALLLLGTLVGNSAAKDNCFGTFSTFNLNSESGDLNGMEIKIVYTRLGKQASIQFSEGEPGPLVTANVICKGNNIHITIPGIYGREESRIDGFISNKKIEGKITYKGGFQHEISIPRHKSYWD